LKTGQLHILRQISKTEREQSERWMNYWHDYSNYTTWQFWVVLAMFVIPLILLILFIDRKKIFQLGFYGYSVHVFFTYTDAIGTLRGTWIYPYKFLPLLPSSVTLDASLVPVSYILLYQYTLNKRKNYYIWMLMLCLALAFFLKPLMVGIGLFHFNGKENFLLLFAGYLMVGLTSKWVTDLFKFLSKTKKWSFNRDKS